jgi:hypothetical protein
LRDIQLASPSRLSSSNPRFWLFLDQPSLSLFNDSINAVLWLFLESWSADTTSASDFSSIISTVSSDSSLTQSASASGYFYTQTIPVYDSFLHQAILASVSSLTHAIPASGSYSTQEGLTSDSSSNASGSRLWLFLNSSYPGLRLFLLCSIITVFYLPRLDQYSSWLLLTLNQSGLWLCTHTINTRLGIFMQTINHG